MFTLRAEATSALEGFERYREQVPYALARSLTETGKDVRSADQDEMQRVFDSPTRWTMNAFMVRYATKSRLYAVVDLKPSASERHYMKVQVHGGIRPKTGLERLLTSRLRYHGIIQTVTPARSARKNKSGNWSKGEMNQVLSNVKAQRDTRTNTTARSAKRSSSAGYFVPRPGSSLSPGVYKRQVRGRVKKVLNFSDAQARYEKRLPLREVADRTIKRRLPIHLGRFMAEAVRTAKR